jgi:hypothetical protein
MGDRRRAQMTDLLTSDFVSLQVALHALRDREDGQTKTGYAILFACLVIAIIIALLFLWSLLGGPVPDSASSVSNAPGP